jgi:hypothetical protein
VVKVNVSTNHEPFSFINVENQWCIWGHLSEGATFLSWVDFPDQRGKKADLARFSSCFLQSQSGPGAL